MVRRHFDDAGAVDHLLDVAGDALDDEVLHSLARLGSGEGRRGVGLIADGVEAHVLGKRREADRRFELLGMTGELAARALGRTGSNFTAIIDSSRRRPYPCEALFFTLAGCSMFLATLVPNAVVTVTAEPIGVITGIIIGHDRP